MRCVVGLILAVSLLLTPVSCFAQASISQSKSPKESAAKTKQVAPPQVEVVLTNGQKVKGRSYGRVYNADCSSCRVEIMLKDTTQTIQCRDVQRIDIHRSFWQKVGHGAENALGIVLFAPSMLLLMIFCREGCDL
jgi:hypothetical protein